MRRLILLVIALIATIVAIVTLRRGAREAERDRTGERDRAGERAKPRPHRPLPGQPTAAQRLRSADEPRGEHAIAGLIVDERDAPVGGARVAIDSLEPVETTSAADGTFRIDGLLPRAYQVEARIDDRYAGPVSVMAESEPDRITLRLHRGMTLVVSVIAKESRAPIAGALVELLSPAALQEWTDGAGRATLRGVAPGHASLRVTADGWASAWVGQSVREDPAPQSIEVALVRGVVPSGRVVDHRGNPVAGARVAIEQCQDASLTGEAAAVTDAHGRWALPTLPPGSYFLVAGHPSFAPGQAFVEATDDTEVTIVLGAGASVVGRVVDGSDAPIARALVTATQGAESFDYRFAPPITAYSGDDGAFAIRGLDPSEVVLIATHERGASDRLEVDLAAGAQHDVVVRIVDGGTIRGVVVAADGTPIAGADVQGHRQFDPGESVRPRAGGRTQDVSDPSGRFELRGLSHGTWDLVATAPGFTRAHVFATPGDGEARLTLERFARVRGKLRFVDGAAPDRFEVGDRWGGRPFAGTGGAFVLDELTPGAQSLVATSEEFPDTDLPPFTIAPGMDHDLGVITIMRGRTVRGRVVTADGAPAPGVRLQIGVGLRTFLPETQEVVTGTDGAFLARGLPDGELEARARHPDRLRLDPERAGTVPLAVGATGDADVGTLRLEPRADPAP